MRLAIKDWSFLPFTIKRPYIIRCAITVAFEIRFIAELSMIMVDSIPIYSTLYYNYKRPDLK
jgi:hypothetical protein